MVACSTGGIVIVTLGSEQLFTAGIHNRHRLLVTQVFIYKERVMAIPVIFPTLAPNAAAPSTEAAAADKARLPIIPQITAVLPYVPIGPRHKDRERARRQAAFEAWLGLRKGEVCWIGSSPTMSKRMNVIHERYQSSDEEETIALNVQV